MRDRQEAGPGPFLKRTGKTRDETEKLNWLQTVMKEESYSLQYWPAKHGWMSRPGKETSAEHEGFSWGEEAPLSTLCRWRGPKGKHWSVYPPAQDAALASSGAWPASLSFHALLISTHCYLCPFAPSSVHPYPTKSCSASLHILL